MIDNALNLIRTAFEACIGFFGQILDGIPGSVTLITAAIVVFLTIRLLLVPILGQGISGASDVYPGKYGNGKVKFYGGSKGKFSKEK